MASFGSRQGLGIDDRTNLVKSGGKLKLSYVRLSLISTGFGCILV
jgi:hypothetical protein